MEITPLLIPLAGIVMGCSIPIVILYLEFRKKRDIYELHHRERMAAIDKGMEVPPLPPELFGNTGPRALPNYLLRGLIWTGIGLGMLIALRRLAGEDEALLGLIPLFVGLAYLLYYAFEGRKISRQASKGETSGGPRGS